MSRERIYGLHAVTALLESEPQQVRALRVLDSRHDERLNRVVSLAEQAGIAIQRVARAELDALAPGARHQGVIAEAESLPQPDEHGLP
ncbi:MAG: RNA methyltransferase substrate-binding domain-containing protein, partial [Gammaproteobacteria bacterium]